MEGSAIAESTLQATFLHGYAALVIAMVSGLFGASFFLLAQLQGRLAEGGTEEARDMWSYTFLFLRCLVGIGGAAILYFFFQSGLLSGSIWPQLNHVGFEAVRLPDVGNKPGEATDLWVPNQHLALLIIWSFLAGYSQTLVPSLLQRTEARAGNGK